MNAAGPEVIRTKTIAVDPDTLFLSRAQSALTVGFHLK